MVHKCVSCFTVRMVLLRVKMMIPTIDFPSICQTMYFKSVFCIQWMGLNVLGTEEAKCKRILTLAIVILLFRDSVSQLLTIMKHTDDYRVLVDIGCCEWSASLVNQFEAVMQKRVCTMIIVKEALMSLTTDKEFGRLSGRATSYKVNESVHFGKGEGTRKLSGEKFNPYQKHLKFS